MTRRLLVYFFFSQLFLVTACNQSEPTKDYPQLSIKWHLVKNFQSNGSAVHEAVFTITNNSSYPLEDNWALYWSQSPRGIVSIDSSKNVSLKHINGDFYEMKALPGFSLGANESVDIKTLSNVWMIKECDGPLGVYIIFDPGEHQNIERIEEFSIVPFTDSIQVTRSTGDKEPIPTAAFLFEANEKLSQLDPSKLFKAIPTPKSYKSLEGQVELKNGYSIVSSESLARETELFLESTELLYGIKGSSTKNDKTDIILLLDNTIPDEEAYRISIEDDEITIEGKDKAGIFYGTQTLLNLIEKKDNSLYIANCQIEDAPAFEYRGLHLDIARNFQGKESVLRIIDILSRYKVNKLVMCLTEDEAWRIEIDGLPELTKVGSKRGHPTPEGTHLQPSYGSGPFVDNPNGSGYYTREDYKEIIKYGYDRHVDIIPMINFPGHARAAVKSMEYRYNRLMKEGKEEEANQFRLIDPDDQSVYRSAQQYNDNVVCVCRQSAYDFYTYVADDVIEMYKEADVPLYMFHTGGDEVPRGAWLKSPLCQEYLKNKPEINTTPEIQAMFFDKASLMLNSKVDRIGGWEEIVMSYDEKGQWYTNTDFSDRNVYPYIWNNLWGQQDLGYKIANRGYPIILCNVTNLYFDLAYNKDPREPGLYWGGFNDTQDAFDFIPNNIFYSTKESAMGQPLSDKDFEGMERLTPESYKRIAGLQGQLWGETVRGQDMLEYYILPKLFGFAQRAWEGQPEWGNTTNANARNDQANTEWNVFANTLSQKHFPMIDKLNGGYHYRIPTPGIKYQDGKIFMNSSYPGMEIRYTLNGKDPTTSSPLYEGPFDFSEGTIKAKVFNLNGRSGLSSTFTTKEDLKVLD